MTPENKLLSNPKGPNTCLKMTVSFTLPLLLTDQVYHQTCFPCLPLNESLLSEEVFASNNASEIESKIELWRLIDDKSVSALMPIGEDK